MEVNNSLPSGAILKGMSYSYRIEKTLGQGSFGITYLASVKMAGALGAIDANIKVAIKEFFMRDINGRSDATVTSGSKGGIYDDYKRKFTREAVNLSKLQHPNIIKVIESFEANNTAYYVMEYIGGGSLDDYITKNNGLKEDEAKRIVKQIGSALSFMHQNKMLHLDLKPSNIMMKESGDIVLIDFGLSKQYDSKGEPESSTKVGAGTPGYAPIEQANYREGKGFPVTMDVYALGATMFKMLTGVRPPEASDILNDGFPLYELQGRGISDSLSACIAKAMAPTKKDRYQSVSEFLYSLDNGEATIVDIETADKEKKRHKDYDEKEYKIHPNTSRVRIDYSPMTPVLAGRYIASVTIDSVDLCRFEESTHFLFDIDRERYNKFLSDLQNLNLAMKEKKTYQPYESSEEPEKLSISLYDDRGVEYAKYWIGGWDNEYGNLNVEIRDLKDKLEIITPWLDEYLKPSGEDKDFSSHDTPKKGAKDITTKERRVNNKQPKTSFVCKFVLSFMACSLCIIGVMYYFHSMPDAVSDQIYAWEESVLSPYFDVPSYDRIIIGLYILLCLFTQFIMESSYKIKLSTVGATIFVFLMFPLIVGVSWLVPAFGEWGVGLFSDMPRGTFFYVIQFFISLCLSMFIVNLYNIRKLLSPNRFFDDIKFDMK